MQQGILERHAGLELRATLVWVDMLQADNATNAREAARAFSDPWVRQFHDPRRIVGTAFSRATFSGYLTQAANTLPEGDPLRPHLESRPADSPLWDVYFFYDPGADWKTAPPRPERWIKQVMLDREEGSLIWENAFNRPPRMVDLVKAIEVAANEWLSPICAPRKSGP